MVSSRSKQKLDLNVSKTKEMVIDFKRNQTDIPPLFIQDKEVERVNEYKYLGSGGVQVKLLIILNSLVGQSLAMT